MIILYIAAGILLAWIGFYLIVGSLYIGLAILTATFSVFEKKPAPTTRKP